LHYSELGDSGSSSSAATWTHERPPKRTCIREKAPDLEAIQEPQGIVFLKTMLHQGVIPGFSAKLIFSQLYNGALGGYILWALGLKNGFILSALIARF
jgi:hypothetical protein